MESEELLALNDEGLIPGPDESEEAFCLRASETKDFFRSQKEVLPSQHWQWPREQLKALFDFSPRWCAASYSSKGLTPWQAAATWINVKRIYMIRIRPSRWVSWLVDRNEVLAHEAAHAARAAFDEPKYEEIFAYLTSSSKWRKAIGPLFQSPGEATFLMALFGMGALSQVFGWFAPLWLFSAFLFCSVWSVRLIRTKTRLERAARRLLPFLKDPAMVRPVLFRMTDREIKKLAGRGAFQPGSDLRWKLIKTAYWKEIHDTAH